MEMFSIDKNKNFKLNFYDNVVVNLEPLFEKIFSFSLKPGENKDFKFKDINKNDQEFNAKRINSNCYELNKYCEKKETSQKIFLFKKVNLIVNGETYPIYSRYQAENLIQNVLKIEGYTFYIKDENDKIIQINIKDFCNYPGKNIELKINYTNQFDRIFKRKKNEKNKEKKLIDLTLNTNEIFEKQELNDEVFIGDGRNEFQNELDKLYKTYVDHFRYYCGQSGIGKTVSLLDYRYKTNNNVLYLNMNILFKKIISWDEFCTAIKNELIYLFKNYEDYNSFIDKIKGDILICSFENIDSIRLRFNKIQTLISKLLTHFQDKGEIFMVIIDQYIKKHDKIYGLTDFLEKATQDSDYLKFVCCCSTDEKDVRLDIYNSLFNKAKEQKKFISINNLIEIDIKNLTEKQKTVSKMFGNLPKYFYRIKNTKDEELDSFVELLKKEIDEDLRKSIKKMNIENEVVYGLLMVMYNINKKIDKAKLKSLFDYIFLKFIAITPINTTNKYFIDFEEENENYILNYNIPIITSVFKMILKEYKKKEYKQHLLNCTEAEEGYILEHLIYLSFDAGEKSFKEELSIYKSYEVDQVYQLSKIYIDRNQEKDILKMGKENFIDNLFKPGQNYHLYQHNENGPKFDGALLVSVVKNDFVEYEKKDDYEIKLKEENDVNNKINIKEYDLIVYQATKKKEKNRVNKNFVTKKKDMIIKNLELLFNIKIRNFNFIYILEFEKKDQSLIKFCESIENQISYIFYSLENNKFVNIKGEELNINRYICEMKTKNNLIQFININNESNEELWKKIISSIPNEFDIEKGKHFITKKTKRDDPKKKIDYKKETNFLSFYDLDGNLILLGEDKTKSKYEESIKQKKNEFFQNYIDEEENEENKIKENQNNITNPNNSDNQQIESKENNRKNPEELIEDLIDKGRHTKQFNSTYNEKLKRILVKMLSEDKEIIEVLNSKNIISYYLDICDIYILNNSVDIPLYYLYRSKDKKYTKLFFKINSTLKIFDYSSENEIANKDYIKELNDMIIVNKFSQDNLIVLCCLVEEDQKRNIRPKRFDDFEY